VKYRGATARDVEAIAGLHADSWRRHYRGALSDAFLDGDVVADRLEVWSARLTKPQPGQCTIVADDDGTVVGFVHTSLDEDPKWGALLDNLHVMYARKRDRIGTRLMAEAATVVLERRPFAGLYLFVLEQNTAAQAFYVARGGACIEREIAPATGGGTVARLRYVWPDPSALLPPNERSSTEE
jgi:ribosomal protein S18 acetylase RimI-like enzyme